MTSNSERIDSSSRIHPSVQLADDVQIGPWCIIGENVSIGAGSVLESNIVVRGNTRLGANNHIYQFSSIGEDPSDKKFSGEESWLEVGDDNIFREGVTVHRGTAFGGGITRIGNHNLLMPYVHIAHDCMVGSHTVFANNASLSGHTVVDDWAILGGYAGVNQFLKIGAHAFVGGMTHIGHDIPAFMIVSGQPATVRSINAIGLERRGFDKSTIAEIREAFKIIYMRNHSLQEALDQLKARADSCAELQLLIDSLEASEKGIHR